MANARNYGGSEARVAGLRQFADALEEASKTEPLVSEKIPSPPRRREIPGTSRWLQIEGLDPVRLDRLQKLDLLSGREVEQEIPPLKREIVVPQRRNFIEGEEIWKPFHPSTILARTQTNFSSLLVDTLPFQIIQNPGGPSGGEGGAFGESLTTDAAGERALAVDSVFTIEGTGEKFSVAASSELLPLSGSHHAPLAFSDKSRNETFLSFEKNSPTDTRAPDGEGRAASSLARLELTPQLVQKAPRACMEYGQDRIAVFPGGVAKKEVVDFEEQALYEWMRPLSREAEVEASILECVLPPFRHQQRSQQLSRRESRLFENRLPSKQEPLPQQGGAPAAQPAQPPPPSAIAAPAGSNAGLLARRRFGPGRRVSFADPPSRSGAGKALGAAKPLQSLQNLTPRKKDASTASAATLASAVSVLPSGGLREEQTQRRIARLKVNLRLKEDPEPREPEEEAPPFSLQAPPGVPRSARLLSSREAAEKRQRRRQALAASGGDCNWSQSSAGGDSTSSGEEGESSLPVLLLPPPQERAAALSSRAALSALRKRRRGAGGSAAVEGVERFASYEGPWKLREAASEAAATGGEEEGGLVPDACLGGAVSDGVSETRPKWVVPPLGRAARTRRSYELPGDAPTAVEDLAGAGGSTRNLLEELAAAPERFLPYSTFPHESRTSSNRALLAASRVSRMADEAESAATVPPSADAALLLAKSKDLAAAAAVHGGEESRGETARGPFASYSLAAASQTLPLREVEELVDGGFKTLRQQMTNEKGFHGSSWQREEVRLKMVVAEPLGGEGPAAQKQQALQEALLKKWLYPEADISPGYYIREEDVEAQKRKLLSAKQNKSVFELQDALRTQRQRAEEEASQRQKDEQAEIHSRLRAAAGSPSSLPRQPSLSPVSQKKVSADEQIATPSGEGVARPTEAGASPSVVPKVADSKESFGTTQKDAPEAEASKAAETKTSDAEGASRLSQDIHKEVEALKEKYRTLKKQPSSEEKQSEMREIKRRIAKLLGRRRRKPGHETSKPRVVSARPQVAEVASDGRDGDRDGDRDADGEDGEKAIQERRARIRKLLEQQRKGVGGGAEAPMLADVIKGDKENRSPGDSGSEESRSAASSENLPEESVPRSSSTETDSDVSVTSYETVEITDHVVSALPPLPYEAIPLAFSAWKSLPLDWTTRVLVENAVPSRGETSASSQRLFLLLELRGPLALFYSTVEKKAKKPRFPASLCWRGPATEFIRGSLQWHFLFGFKIDADTQLERAERSLLQTQRAAATDLQQSFTAVRVRAKNCNAFAIPEPWEQRTGGGRLTPAQKTLQDALALDLYLSADSPDETLNLEAHLKARRALAAFAAVCADSEASSKAPSSPQQGAAAAGRAAGTSLFVDGQGERQNAVASFGVDEFGAPLPLRRPTLTAGLAASMFCALERKVDLSGVPFSAAADRALFTALGASFYEKLIMRERGLGAQELRALPSLLKNPVNSLALQGNRLDPTALSPLLSVTLTLCVRFLNLAENPALLQSRPSLAQRESAAGAPSERQTAEAFLALVKDTKLAALDLRFAGASDSFCEALSLLTRSEGLAAKPGGPSKTAVQIGLEDNDLALPAARALANTAAAQPRVGRVFFGDCEGLDAETLESFNPTPQQLNALPFPVPALALDANKQPKVWLKLPVSRSGRLFVQGLRLENNKLALQSAATPLAAAAPQGPFDLAALVELKGPALLMHAAPQREETWRDFLSGGAGRGSTSRQTPISPKRLADSWGLELRGWVLRRVELREAKQPNAGASVGEGGGGDLSCRCVLEVVGLPVQTDFLLGSVEEKLALQGETDEETREWFRVLSIRLAGIRCLEAAAATAPLSEGLVDYCTSGSAPSLTLSGRSLTTAVWSHLLSAVRVDSRLRRVDCSNTGLTLGEIRRLPQKPFERCALQVLDLGFNQISLLAGGGAGGEDAAADCAAFCTSATNEKDGGAVCRLVLDGNNLGDGPPTASFLVALLYQPQLKHISLNACNLGPAFGAAAADMLEKHQVRIKNESLETLELACNAIPQEFLAQIIDCCTVCCKRLRRVRVGGNPCEALPLLRRKELPDFSELPAEALHPHAGNYTRSQVRAKPSKKALAQQEADRAATAKALLFVQQMHKQNEQGGLKSESTEPRYALSDAKASAAKGMENGRP